MKCEKKSLHRSRVIFFLKLHKSIKEFRPETLLSKFQKNKSNFFAARKSQHLSQSVLFYNKT